MRPFTSLAALLLLIVAAPAAAAPAPTWDVRSLSYVHNLEFFEDAYAHQEGRTYFGQHMVLHGLLEPAPGLRLGAGLLLDVQFGRDRDENWDAVEPWIFLESDLGASTLRFGNLDRRRQRLHNALIDPGLFYECPADRGLSVRGAAGPLTHRTWIQWRLQEREDRRELFDVGLVLDWNHAARPLSAELQAHVVHRGGQLSSVGRLEESWGVLLGPAWRPHLGGDGWRANLGARVGICADRRWKHDGRAGELRLGLERGGFLVSVEQWWSEDWATMDGRPLYRTRGVTGWGARQRWRPGGVLHAELGGRIHQRDGDAESEFWLLLDLAGLASE